MSITFTKTFTFEWRDEEILVNGKSISIDSVTIRINEGKLALDFQVSTSDHQFLRKVSGMDCRVLLCTSKNDFEDIGPSRGWPVDGEIEEIWVYEKDALPF